MSIIDIQIYLPLRSRNSCISCESWSTLLGFGDAQFSGCFIAVNRMGAELFLFSLAFILPISWVLFVDFALTTCLSSYLVAAIWFILTTCLWLYLDSHRNRSMTRIRLWQGLVCPFLSFISDNLTAFIWKCEPHYFSESSMQCTKPYLQSIACGGPLYQPDDKGSSCPVFFLSCFYSFSTSQFYFWCDSNNGSRNKQIRI